MPTAQQWKEKADASLSAARLCLDHGNLPGAANRLWYVVFHAVHATMIHRGLQPRPLLGTWAHEEVEQMYLNVVRRLVRSPAARASLNQARGAVHHALRWRIAADYGDHAVLVALELQRAVAQISRVLQYLHQEVLP